MEPGLKLICTSDGMAQKTKDIFMICCIYTSNNFVNGVSIKTSRFNHSYKPNAVTMQMVNGLRQVRAISNIKSRGDLVERNTQLFGYVNILSL